MILGGLAGSGFTAAMLTRDLWNKPSPENISTSEATSTPPPPPLPKFPTQTFTTVKVNSRGEIISRPQHQAEVMTEKLGYGVSIEMVKIPAGRFLMGSPETEAGRFDQECPQHYVECDSFLLGASRN